MTFPPNSDVPPDSTETSLPGRAAEWQALLERCQQALSGSGGACWLVGEAGIGKTRLQTDLQAWAAGRGFTVLWGHHIGHRYVPPLHGIRGALSQLLAVEPDATPEQIAARIDRHIADDRWSVLRRHRRTLLRFLEPLSDPAGARRGASEPSPHLYHLLVRVLTASARQRPLLLLLDDVHWADAATLDFLGYLTPFLADQPILIVASRRPGESEHGQLLEGLCLQPNAVVLPVPRLDLEATTSMAQRAGVDADATFCAKLYQLTEGVPLFIEQWLLHVGSAPSPVEGLTSQRPESITQTISRRLQSLPPAARPLVEAAAVLGDRFSCELLQRVDGRPLSDVLDLVADLETRAHVFRADSAAADDGTVAFSHAILRQVAYDGIARSRRQLLHGRAGVALQERLTSQPEAVFDVSHHFTMARRQDRAASVLFQAGLRARDLGAHDSAGGYLEQALELADGGRQRADIRSALGNVRFAGGDREGGRDLWLAALNEQDDPVERAVLYRKLGQSWADSDYARQWRYFHLGLEESRRHPHAAVRGELLAELALVPDPEHGGTARDLARIASQAAEAMRILRRPEHQGTFAFLLIHLFTRVYLRLGDRRNANIARKSRLLRRGIRLGIAHDDWDLAIHGRIKLAEMWESVDLTETLALADAALELADDCLAPGTNRITSLVRRMLQFALAAGDHARVERYCRRLGLQPDGPLPGLEAYQWRDHPQAAWQAHVTRAHEICARGMVGMALVTHVTRLQRIAHHFDRQQAWHTTLSRLQQQHPDYYASLPPIEWGLTPIAGNPDAPGTGPCCGAEDLRWEDPIGNSECPQHDREGVVIVPGPGVGLGWHRRAPSLIHAVDGDFTFEARIPQQAASRRAGGLAVWDGRGRLIRFASGVDHEGQISLAWNNGDQLRYACAGYLPDGDILMRLVRRGRRYTATLRDASGQWYACGQLSFGDAGPVDVALFAEANHDFDVPELFPIRFDAVRLRLDATPSVQHAPRATAVLYPLPTVPEPFFGMVGLHRTFRAFCQQLEEVSRSALPLLICGESGTGKELAARATHLLSQHKEGPYVPLNVAALPEGTMASELFGHVQGAFTGATRDHAGLFAAAAGGSIFLDEIGELALEMQARLLRVLDSGEIRPLGSTAIRHVDTRMIAATSRDLGRDVEDGRFRRDLYFRFAEPLVVPALRQRREDIPLLVAHFVELYGQGAEYRISRRAMRALCEHAWPDNIRGLRHVVERAVLAAESRLIGVEHLALRSASEPAADATPVPRPTRGDRRALPDRAELHRLGVECRGNVAALSRHFHVSRLTMYRWLEARGLDLQQLRDPPG